VKVCSGFAFEKAEFVFIFVRKQRMFRREVRGVQPVRYHVSHVGMQIGRFDPEYQAARVGKQ